MYKWLVVLSVSVIMFMIFAVYGLLANGTFDMLANTFIGDSNSEKPIDSKPFEPIDEPSIPDVDGFDMKYKYLGNNEWSYVIDGYLPTPCHSFEHSVVVMESFPEQVVVTGKLVSPPADTMCVQVIKIIQETGKFSASEKASVRFELVKK